MIAQVGWGLNVLGLSLSTIAAALMYYFPPRTIQYTEKGEPDVTWIGNATIAGKRIGKWQIRLSRLSPWLLAVGFLMQLVSFLVATTTANVS